MIAACPRCWNVNSMRMIASHSRRLFYAYLPHGTSCLPGWRRRVVMIIHVPGQGKFNQLLEGRWKIEKCKATILWIQSWQHVPIEYPKGTDHIWGNSWIRYPLVSKVRREFVRILSHPEPMRVETFGGKEVKVNMARQMPLPESA